jgi:hypothetical protein
MTEQSSTHFYLNWTKERIDEMDAALASLEVKASQAKTDSKEKADEIICRSEEAPRQVSSAAVMNPLGIITLALGGPVLARRSSSR